MLRLVAVLGVILRLAAPVHAQTGSVSGTVVDESGGVVPGATVVLVGAGGRQTASSGARGEYSFENLASGTYDIIVSLVGFGQATRSGVVVGSSAAPVPPIELAVARFGETVVVSAARIETAMVDAPATMSVIGSEVLTTSPAQNYGDLLRTVPGVNVVQLSARDVNVTSRQATSTLSNSQLVLLDGRSIYLDFFGLVLWDFLPTNLADIRQIEVIRGPASAVWGANALTGVVNIITKSPREAPGATSLTIGGGLFNRDFGSTEGRGAGGLFSTNITTSQVASERWSYRLSGGYYNSAAYARPVGSIPVIVDPRDPTGRTTVGGATYPADAEGALGTAYRNQGTNQPKFDTRVDQ